MTKRGEVRAFVDSLLALETDECVMWPYSVGSHGYGDFWRDGDHHLVHRWVCAQEKGPPADNMDAAHSCGRDLCCNKRHLSWKTRADNLKDKVLHGTHLEGEKIHFAVLTEPEVLIIRAAPQYRGVGVHLAEKYNVSQGTVSMVRSRKTWKHL